MTLPDDDAPIAVPTRSGVDESVGGHGHPVGTVEPMVR